MYVIGVADSHCPAELSNCCCYMQVREEVETKAGKKFAEFLAIEYSTQVVAGTNYFVKVRIYMCKI